MLLLLLLPRGGFLVVALVLWGLVRPGAALQPRRSVVTCSARPTRRVAGGSSSSSPSPPERQRQGDWTCKSCRASNFAYRSSCYKCRAKGGGGAGKGAPRGRRQNQWTWAAAAAKGELSSPSAAVADIVGAVWWLRDIENALAADLVDIADARKAEGLGDLPEDPDELRATLLELSKTYSLDDASFREPSFNPRVKPLALCVPEVYEEVARKSEKEE